MAMFNGGAAAAAPNTQALPETRSSIQTECAEVALSSYHLAEDVMHGGDAIAHFMGWTARQVYHLAANHRFPYFKLGNVICARKSTLLAWIAEQERACLEEQRQRQEAKAHKDAIKEVTRRPVRRRKGAAQ